MLTDRPPRLKALLTDFRASDQLAMLELPEDDRLRGPAKAIEAAMRPEEIRSVRKHITSSGTFLSTLCHEFCHHFNY